MIRTTIPALLATVMTFAMAATASADLTDGLILLYEFENANDLGENSASGGSSGVNSGVAHSSSGGIVGDASDWAADLAIISVAESDLPNIEFPDGGGGDGSRTIAFWVKTTETERSTFYAASALAYGLSFADNRADWRSYSTDYSPFNNNQLELHSNIAGLGFSATHNTLDDASFSLHDDVWHHVAATLTYDSGTLTTTLYADGELLTPAESNPNSRSLPDGFPLTHFTLGTNAEAADDQDLNGLLDEFAIWNRELSPTEISTIYDNGLAGQGIVPEPSSILLVISGLVGLSARSWRRRTG